jgi:hypothetical protein
MGVTVWVAANLGVSVIVGVATAAGAGFGPQPASNIQAISPIGHKDFQKLHIGKIIQQA